MRLFVANLLVFLGALLVIASYYYFSRIYQRYLRYVERQVERSSGWKKGLNEKYLAIQIAGGGLFTLEGSIVAYLLLGFGITASLCLIQTTASAIIYAGIIAGVSFPYNYMLLIFEKRRDVKKSVRLLRLFTVNGVIAASLILGAALRKGDNVINVIIIICAVVFFVAVSLFMIFPVLRYFYKSTD